MFVQRAAGESVEGVLERLEQEAEEDAVEQSGGTLDGQRQRQVTAAVFEVLGDAVEDNSRDDCYELSDSELGIQVGGDAGELYLSVPFWHTGPDAEAVLAKVHRLARRIEEITGLEGIDPQREEPLTNDWPTQVLSTFSAMSTETADWAEPPGPPDSTDPSSPASTMRAQATVGWDRPDLDWSGYELYVPPHPGLPEDMTRAQARECFEYLMEHRYERIEFLRRLLADNDGPPLGDSDDDLNRLDAWYQSSVQPDPDNPGYMLGRWRSVATDIGLHLGETMIKRAANLHWEFYTWGSRIDFCYHRATLMGFTQVENPRYGFGLADVVADRGDGVVSGEGSGRPFFTKLVANVRDA